MPTKTMPGACLDPRGPARPTRATELAARFPAFRGIKGRSSIFGVLVIPNTTTGGTPNDGGSQAKA